VLWWVTVAVTVTSSFGWVGFASQWRNQKSEIRNENEGKSLTHKNRVCLMQINEERTRNIITWLMTHSLLQNAPFSIFGFGKGS
jgi:hypothetical protein